MVKFDPEQKAITGEAGSLPVQDGDEVTRKLVMLIEGQCQGVGSVEAAKKYGYTKQRYHQLLKAFEKDGSLGLVNKRRGPKSNYRRTDEIVRQVIRHRFLDPEASAQVIAQKLRQSGFVLSVRSVERTIADYGLQKKTLQVSSRKRKGS